LLHELLHARYLIDNYGFDVYHGTNNSRIEIVEDGTSIVDSYFSKVPTIVNGVSGFNVYRSKEDDIMGAISQATQRRIGELSAAILNHLKGQRPTSANWNAANDISKHLNLIPQINRIRFRDQSGQVLVGCSVKVFQASRPQDTQVSAYGKVFDNEPDLELLTDAAGYAVAGPELFAGTQGGVIHHLDYSNAVIIVRVEHEGKIGFVPIQVSDFVIEYLKGNANEASYEYRVLLK